MITIDEIDLLEEKWVENRTGFLKELKNKINSVKQNDVSCDVWNHLLSLKSRIDLFENYEPRNLPYNGPREGMFGTLMYPGDEFYETGSIYP